MSPSLDELLHDAARELRWSIEGDLIAQITPDQARALLAIIEAHDQCPECSRSFGPHYTGPCEH